MADLPVYLQDEQKDSTILQRMLDALPDDLDKSEGGFVWDALAPAAIELALAAQWAQEVLRRVFASTTFGAYLDLRAEEHGLTRRPAVQATGVVTFSGVQGTVIPVGTRVSTASSDVVPAILFETTEEATIPPAGIVDVPVRAVEGGIDGNVAAGTITFLATVLAGVNSVTNAQPTSGGLDEEDDASLLARYLQRVRNPSAGGNKADYINWALEVPGVGGVAVVPVRDGPGTVSVVIVDSDKKPADQALVDKVQDYIAPPHRLLFEAEDLPLAGQGGSIDGTQVDDSGDSVKLMHDPDDDAAVLHQIKDADTELLPQPGIWQARIRLKADSTSSSVALLWIAMWNDTIGAEAEQSPGGDPAVLSLAAEDLSTSFAEYVLPFYWNGSDYIHLAIFRQRTDTTTVVWVDQVTYRSTFSRDDGDGKAPIGARVSVEPATAVLVNVSATLTIADGYNAASVQAAVTQSIDAYLKSLAFTSDNDVRYARIANAILDTPGVQDYQNLLVNGGTANVTIGEQEVAVLGTVTWS